MKYIDQLNFAKKEKINMTKLFIAYEVQSLLKNYNKEIKEEAYEEICSIVYEYYLKIDYSSINDIAKIVCDLFFNSKIINKKNICEKLENMYL